MNSNGKFQDHIRRLFITHLQLTELDLLIFLFFPHQTEPHEIKVQCSQLFHI